MCETYPPSSPEARQAAELACSRRFLASVALAVKPKWPDAAHYLESQITNETATATELNELTVAYGNSIYNSGQLPYLADSLVAPPLPTPITAGRESYAAEWAAA